MSLDLDNPKLLKCASKNIIYVLFICWDTNFSVLVFESKGVACLLVLEGIQD